MSLRLEVLLGNLAQLKCALPIVIPQFGIQELAWELLTAPVPWMAVDRQQVKMTLETIMYGSLDNMGLPRYELPAEFIAATICCLVHPVNYQKACAFVENTYTAEAISHENITEREVVLPSRLFAMMCRVPQADLTGFRQDFEKSNAYNIERSEQKQKKN